MASDPSSGSETAKTPRSRRLPRKATPKRLARGALAYLDRYAASSGQLRRILMGRVERSARLHDTDRKEGAAAVEAIIARLQTQGLLNDRAYAAAKAASLQRRGQSLKAIAAYLARKSLGKDDIAAAPEALRAADDGAEEAAAATYCRKRRIGPHRPPDDRAAMRQKDLAALARRGFSYDTACRVLDAEADWGALPEGAVAVSTKTR